MFCTQCGKQLPDDARFCTACGARIANQEPSANELAGDFSGPIAPANNNSPENTSLKQTSENGDFTSLVPAVKETQRRSRGRMRLAALIVLALALTSAIAFAAYYAYTNMQQQAPESVQVETQQADEQPTEETPSESKQSEEQSTETEKEKETSKADQAVEAYQPIIDDFRALASDYSTIAASSARTDGTRDAFEAEHPYTRLALQMPQYARSWLNGDETPVYAFRDLNSDGMPECLLGAKSNSGEIYIWDIWTIKDGVPIKIAYGQEKGLLTLRQNNVIQQYNNSGAASGTETYFRIGNSENLVDISQYNGIDDLSAINTAFESNTMTLSSVSWDGMPSTGISKVIIIDEQGASTQGDPANWQADREALASKYPANETAEWMNLLDE